jgi:hypothetical protein
MGSKHLLAFRGGFHRGEASRRVREERLEVGDGVWPCGGLVRRGVEGERELSGSLFQAVADPTLPLPKDERAEVGEAVEAVLDTRDVLGEGRKKAEEREVLGEKEGGGRRGMVLFHDFVGNREEGLFVSG